MTSIDSTVRTRAAIQERISLLLIGLIVLTLITGWWAYQVHMVPEFEQDQRVVDQWSEETDFAHQAEIIRDSLVWDEGDIVVDRPIYYTNLTDELDGTYSYEFDAEEGSLSVNSDIMFVIQAVEGIDQIDDPFWHYAVPLGEASDTNLEADGVHEAEFTIDIREHILEPIATIEEQVGAREGLVDVRVTVVTHVEGVVEGEEHNVTYESHMPMVVNPDTFRVIELDTVSQEHSDTIQFEVQVPPSTFEEMGSLGLLTLMILLTLALVLGQVTGQFDITEEERELLELESQREEFDDWITVGKFPAERDYESTILVDNLVGLVDVAIDTNNRVIEDPELGVSAVLAENYVYIYVHPDSPARDWLMNYADVTMEEFEGDGPL